jgi:ferredoxin
MKVKVDLFACQSYANCVIEAPEVFDLDEGTSKVVVLLDPVPEELLADAERAVASCPVKAIELVD